MAEGVLLKLEGQVVETLNKPNRNGRIYTKELFENNVLNNEIVKERLLTHSLFGEFEPTYRAWCVDSSKISHNVSKLYIEEAESKTYDNLDQSMLYPFINKQLCIGCGSCVNICSQDVYTLDRFLGPIIPTKNLLIDEDACVSCFLCEENCPTQAIVLNSQNIPELDDNKCIRCNVCTMKCPVGALNFENLNYNDD